MMMEKIRFGLTEMKISKGMSPTMIMSINKAVKVKIISGTIILLQNLEIVQMMIVHRIMKTRPIIICMVLLGKMIITILYQIVVLEIVEILIVG